MQFHPESLIAGDPATATQSRARVMAVIHERMIASIRRRVIDAELVQTAGGWVVTSYGLEISSLKASRGEALFDAYTRVSALDVQDPDARRKILREGSQTPIYS